MYKVAWVHVRHGSAGIEAEPSLPGALGFNVRAVQWYAFVISAMLCGVAGLLMANLSAFASPSIMSWFVSSELIVMVVLGGVGSVFGPVLGAVAFIGAEEIAKASTAHWAAYIGVAVIIISVWARNGIVGLIAFRTAKSLKVSA